MKVQLGFKALTLISLSFFTWSGWVYAQDIEDAWTADENGRMWTVTKAGGHMEEGDMFSIEQLSANGQINLVPGPKIKNRWRSEISEVDLSKKNINKQDFLCGFANVDTDQHKPGDEGFTPYSHGKWHGFLIKVKESNELWIIWSARSFGNGSKPGQAKCDELEIDFHGGMAHANG